MIIYKFRNQETFVWFIIGFFVVALPAAYALQTKGVNLDIYQEFAIAAFAALIGGFISAYIQRALAKRRFFRLNEYWEEKLGHDMRAASQRFPIKNLTKGSPEFENTFKRNLEYFDTLSGSSKAEMMTKFGMSDDDWSVFMLQSLEQANGKKFTPYSFKTPV